MRTGHDLVSGIANSKAIEATGAIGDAAQGRRGEASMKSRQSRSTPEIAQGFSGRERERGAAFLAAKLPPAILRLTTADQSVWLRAACEETIPRLICVDGAVEEIGKDCASALRRNATRFGFAQLWTISKAAGVEPRSST